MDDAAASTLFAILRAQTPGRSKDASDSEPQLLARYGQNESAMALGRRSYLFAGSDVGGERAAAMYSLIGSCKLNKIDPESYLRYVFERIADHPINRIDELLPWNVSLSHATPMSRAA